MHEKKKVYCILLDENKNEKKDTPSHQVGINTRKGPVGHMPKLFNRGSAIVPTAKRDKTTKGHHLVINNIKKSYKKKILLLIIKNSTFFWVSSLDYAHNIWALLSSQVFSSSSSC